MPWGTDSRKASSLIFAFGLANTSSPCLGLRIPFRLRACEYIFALFGLANTPSPSGLRTIKGCRGVPCISALAVLANGDAGGGFDSRDNYCSGARSFTSVGRRDYLPFLSLVVVRVSVPESGAPLRCFLEEKDRLEN